MHIDTLSMEIHKKKFQTSLSCYACFCMFSSYHGVDKTFNPNSLTYSADGTSFQTFLLHGVDGTSTQTVLHMVPMGLTQMVLV